MKLTLTALVSGFAIASVLSTYGPRLHAQSEPIHLTSAFTSAGDPLILTADNVERDANEVRLRGNVQIQLRPQSPNASVMVLHADEAIYRLKTDEIVPSGNVRVTIEKPK